MADTNVVIFSDLDGTLLDKETYSFDAALPALERIREAEIPLILCSSKTRAEIEVYQQKLGITDPFISENGGAIFVPKGYFPLAITFAREVGVYQVIELGTPYKQLRDSLLQIRKKLDIGIIGFGDLSPLELAEESSLPLAEAELAIRREYDEPFRFLAPLTDKQKRIVKKFIKKRGLRITRGGRYFHLTGNNDKGQAVSILILNYASTWKTSLFSVGLGDSLNDLPMLEAVDWPVLVKKKDGTYDQRILQKMQPYLAEGMGPEGWNEAVLKVLEKITQKS